MAILNPGIHIALVASTAADARDVMVEGESGILATCSTAYRPLYEPSKRRLTWQNGSTATTFSAESPEDLRGPQHHIAWCDELGKWRYQDETWSNLMFGLRLMSPGTRPQVFISTTPRTTDRLKKILALPTTAITRDTSYANRANLDPNWYANLITEYEGTRLGRQEISGELLDDNPGALWQWGVIEPYRIKSPQDLPTLTRVVVAVDPAVTDEIDSDMIGIVVAAKGIDNHFYVLDDCSMNGSPLAWASAVSAAYNRYRADRVIAEENQGGKLVEENLRRFERHMSYKGVRAKEGKKLRAEPVAHLYERGLVHHVGNIDKLEEQMTEWDPALSKKSPDRVDALVYALTELSACRSLNYTRGLAV